MAVVARPATSIVTSSSRISESVIGVPCWGVERRARPEAVAQPGGEHHPVAEHRPEWNQRLVIGHLAALGPRIDAQDRLEGDRCTASRVLTRGLRAGQPAISRAAISAIIDFRRAFARLEGRERTASLPKMLGLGDLQQRVGALGTS